MGRAVDACGLNPGMLRMTRGAQPHGEIELKFDLDQAAADVIEDHPLLAGSERRHHAQRSTYFDTPNGKLGKAGYSLRVRQVGVCFTQTLKTRASHAGLFDRGEWEMPVSAMRPEQVALARTPLSKLRKVSSLVATGHSKVERTEWLVDHRGSLIQVCLDRGTVSNGSGEHRFHELELELRQGDPAALFAVARILAEAVPLRLGVLAKDERAEMPGTGAEQPRCAPTITLDKGMTVEAVFAQIAQSCIRHLRLNETLIVAGRDAEALHQARIAMRRLRAAMSFFRPAIRRSGLRRLRSELSWLTTSLADARDVDVLIAHHDDLSRADRRKLRLARSAAYAQATGAIDSQRLRGFLLDLVEWLSTAEWQKKSATLPILTFASRRLDRLWKEVRQRSSHLVELDDTGLHRLRIAVKKLRYAVEFLDMLYGKRARKFASRLEKVQDGLGLMNDEAVGRNLIAALSLRSADESCQATRAKRLDALENDFRRLGKAGRFWND